MTVRERVLACRLMEEMRKHEAFCKEIGIYHISVRQPESDQTRPGKIKKEVQLC